MNDTQKIQTEEAQVYPLPMDVLLDRRYTHRYIDPSTGKLRMPEDIAANERLWKSCGKPTEIKVRG
jgi:hypothetical protein